MMEQTALCRAWRGILATDLYAFLERAFRDIDKRLNLIPAPYVELLTQALSDVALGKELRLIINLPPRHLKSVIASVAFPAWLLGNDPSKRIAVISHSQSLANDLAIRCHRLTEMSWYRENFPSMRLAPDRNRTLDFETTQGGGRFAASMDTGVTGRGFDVIIIDDPLSAQDARSEAARDNVISTYEAMLASRLDNPARGAVVVVHQRLHENDLSGYLLSRGGWRHISLPLVAEATTTYQLPSGLWVRRAGEPLVPEFWPPDVIRDTRAKGAGIFAAQYQQNPSATEGDLIERRHIRTFDKLPLGAKEIVLSFDTATKTGDNSSYSVGLVIARDETRHYVIDIFRARVDPVELRDAALRLIARYRPQKILIEDASSGTSLHAMLRERNHRADLWPTRARNKEERLQSVLHYFVEGRVFIKADEVWTVDLISEWMRFPLARHDDQVDAMSQYLTWYQESRPVPFHLAKGLSQEDRVAAKFFGSPPRKGEHPMRPRHGRQFLLRPR
jgi:predicted phage terminase large subunit-like protein